MCVFFRFLDYQLFNALSINRLKVVNRVTTTDYASCNAFIYQCFYFLILDY